MFNILVTGVKESAQSKFQQFLVTYLSNGFLKFLKYLRMEASRAN